VLTDARGHRAHFGEVTVVMTSNVFETERRVGYGHQVEEGADAVNEKVALRRVFSKEFLGRAQTVAFRSLGVGDLETIVGRHLIRRLRQRLRDRASLTVDPSVCRWLAERGESELFGARNLIRLFEEHVTVPVVAKLGYGRDGVRKLRITLDGDPPGIVIRPE